MSCPTCGIDHHAQVDEPAAEAVADAIVESAAIDAAAQQAQAETYAAASADDNDTRERIAEIDAQARVDVAEAEAGAAVAIAAADAAADVAIAEALAGEADETGEDATVGDEPGEIVDGSGEAAAVEVPPQLDDASAPVTSKTEGRRTVSAFRAHRMGR